MDEVDRLTRLAGENRLELLLFRLVGKQIYGINVFKIREILPCPPVRHVPYAHRFVRGVMQAREQTLSVIDLSAALGQAPSVDPTQMSVIVTEYCGRVLGYLVNSVVRIVNLEWEDIKPPPPFLGDSSYMTAVASIDDVLVEIIDIEKILSEIFGFSAAVTAHVEVPESEGMPPRHVLIADDSVVARKQIARVMEQIGVTYELAENGRAALEKLQEHAAQGNLLAHFGMVISDIEMPEMDGYTLTKTIKADAALKPLYVLLHTSLSGSFNQAMTESVGAERLMPKFDPDELARAVAQVLLGGDAPAQVAA